MSATLSFGKYKNFTIHEVYDKDPSYCRWLRNQKMLIEDTDSDISKFLASKFANGSDDGSYLLNFGKYKGKSVKQVFAIDKQYLQWLRSSKFATEMTPKLCAAIDELINKLIDICFDKKNGYSAYHLL
ncbi:hypothetical protein JG687_00016403 [Phytophthora cactorum]|uniref:Exodeoxyribonuclease X-like C-terminal domain-containing protein n=1 Tax=Phytophthora cactorum TaxID=29920 RepID=A0A8T1TS88_9STRA|nr:hypothetical protein JG687_00016403 [Phytophthora cactorum]